VTKQQVGEELQSLVFLIICQCAVSETSGHLCVPNWYCSFTSDKSSKRYRIKDHSIGVFTHFWV